jgi:hypothetical protein
MNKKLLTILIATICVLSLTIALDAVATPSAAVWVDEGSGTGTAENIVPNWNANLKYMLFKIKLSDGSLNDIETTVPLLEYDEDDERLELISDPTVYVTSMAFTGYTGTISAVVIPSTKMIEVDGDEYHIPVDEVTSTAFATTKNFITSIVFPSSIRIIGQNACSGMSELLSVTFESVNDSSYSLLIRDNAFASNSKLQTVHFNGDWNVASSININRFAFLACTALAEVWFNSTTATVPTFGANVFFGTLSTLRGYMWASNRGSYTTALTAARAVGFYDVTTAGFDLTTVVSGLTWYTDKECTQPVATPTSVVTGRYFVK